MSPIVIGRFGKTFGTSGWIKVISFTQPEENILQLNPWLINKQGSWQNFSFEDFKKRANGIVVKIPECSSPEEASLFTNIEIGVLRENLPEPKKDEYYWHDLVGLEVINKEGINLGRVKELMATGSNDVLVVVGKRRILIPYLSHVVAGVDLEEGVIKVDWGEDF